MRGIWIVTLLAVTGCSNEVEDAKKEYEIVAKNGSSAEKCAAGKKVVAALLKAQKEGEYNEQKLYNQIECQAADLDAKR